MNRASTVIILAIVIWFVFLFGVKEARLKIARECKFFQSTVIHGEKFHCKLEKELSII